VFMRRHLLDVALAHTMLRQPDEALGILARLLVETPEWLRHQRMTSDSFQDALRLGKKRRVTRQQRELAAFFDVAQRTRSVHLVRCLPDKGTRSVSVSTG
jgi:hypothetical protein